LLTSSPLVAAGALPIRILHVQNGALATQHAAIIAQLALQTFTETFGHLFPPAELAAYLDATFSEANIEKGIGNSDNYFLLAYVGEQAVGYLKLKRHSAHLSGVSSRSAQLQKIYVLQAFLAQKAGLALLQQAIAQATAEGFDAMWLSVLHSNARAIRFYEHAGFTCAGEHSFSIGSQTFQFLIMARPLLEG
jgi:ribosomal protein S18 acetylase RimI-like enzyme